jgi:hypothetical protein
MERWNGIGDFLEDFIEQAHQFGMREEKRTANMRDQVSYSRYPATLQ